MATDATHPLTQEQIRAIASGFTASDQQDVGPTPAKAETSWRRACARLARSLMRETWHQSAAVDIGLWGRWIYRREAASYLSELAERGALYISGGDQPGDAAPGPSSWLGRLRRRIGG